MAATIVLTSSLLAPSAANESASCWRRTRSASSRARRSASACAAAAESARARSAAAAESALATGAIVCGVFLPQPAATTAAPKPITKSNDTGFIYSLPSGGGRGSLRKPWRPSRQPRAALLQQRTDTAGVKIDDPQLAVSRPVRRERQVTTVGRPGRILVTSYRGELPHRAG